MKSIITIPTLLVAGLILCGAASANAADTDVSSQPAILADLEQRSGPASSDAAITALDETELAAARGEAWTRTFNGPTGLARATAVYLYHRYGLPTHGAAHTGTKLHTHFGGFLGVIPYWHVHHP